MQFPQWYYIHRQQRHKSRAAHRTATQYTFMKGLNITKTCQCCDSANVLLGGKEMAALGNEKSLAGESPETRWLFYCSDGSWQGDMCLLMVV